MTTFAAIAQAQSALDTILSAIDAAGAGSLVIYSGTPPADADTALSGNTVLATLALPNPAFGNAVDGAPNAVATGNAIAQVNASATGTATFFRYLENGGTTIIQGDVTATGGGGAMQVNTTSFVSGVAVTVTASTATMAEQV